MNIFLGIWYTLFDLVVFMCKVVQRFIARAFRLFVGYAIYEYNQMQYHRVVNVVGFLYESIHY